MIWSLFCTFTLFITVLKRARNHWWGWTMMLSLPKPLYDNFNLFARSLGMWQSHSTQVHAIISHCQVNVLFMNAQWNSLWLIAKWYQSCKTSSKNIQSSSIHSWQTLYFFFNSFCRYTSSEPILTFSSLYNGSQLELLTLSSPRTIQNWTLSLNSVSNPNAFTCSKIFQPLFKYIGMNVFLKEWMFSFTFFPHLHGMLSL